MEPIKFGSTSNLIRFTLKDKTTGQGKTGLSISTTGLIISTICDNEATPTVYTQAGSTIETIATLATFATPTATKCRFKEVDATNNKGLYEFQFANARFAVSNAKRLIISVNDAESTILDADYQIILTQFDFFDARVNVGKWLDQAVTLDSVNIPIVSSNIVRTGTAQGGTRNSIKLDSSASATNDIYKGGGINIIGGTGVNQKRTITGYNGSTKQVTPDRQFITAPDNTSIFNITYDNDPALNVNLQVVAGVAQVVIWSGTAQTGSTSNTIKIDSGASTTNNIYVNANIQLTGGTGVGQTRTIISYDGATKIVTVDKNWIITPDNTTTFSISASTTPSTFSDTGVAQAASSSTITLASTSSTSNSVYNGSFVTILSGTGAGQTQEIASYVGSTHVATISSTWSITPDSTSAYAVLPTLGTDLPTTMNANVISIDNAVKLPSSSLANINDGTYDLRQLIIMMSELVGLGKISGLPTGPAVLRNRIDSVNRATITFDANNNRTTIVINNAP